MSFRIISSEEVATLDGIRLEPHVRYVLPSGWAQTLAAGLKAGGHVYTMSVWNSYERRYAGQPLNGKRLAIYRHAAFGDQLIVTSLAAYLRQTWPAAKIDVYCVPKVLDLWEGIGVRALPAPLTFDAARSYDYHLFLDQMLEEDREPEQGNAYDNLFAFAGLEVEDRWKRPAVVPQRGDLAELEAMKFEGWLPEKYVLLQLQANNPNRTYPPELAADFVDHFLAVFGAEWQVIVVGLDKAGEIWSRFNRASMRNTEVPEGRVINLVGKLKKFRSLIPLVQFAKLVVCPDSSVGHLAAAFPAVPVISLWGIFHPDDRVKYYRNHHPLFAPAACPFAPCRNHEFKLPQEKCRQAVNATPGEQPSCNALRAIRPEMILAKATEILSGKPGNPEGEGAA